MLPAITLLLGFAATTSTDTVNVRTEAPIWGNNVRLVQELTIGTLNGPEEYAFASIVGLTVGPDGSIYVLERNPPIVRQYTSSGRFVRTFGRQGQGPGEFAGPEAIAISKDRLVIRDNRNQRLTVFPLGGGPPDHWPYRTMAGSFLPMTVHLNGSVLVPTQVIVGRDFAQAVFRYGAEGSLRDTVFMPHVSWSPLELKVTTQGGSATYSIPYAPAPVWAAMRDGRFVGGVSDRYVIMVVDSATVLRTERKIPPVQISRQEREDSREAIVSRIRRSNNPSFRWDGSGMPTAKPFFREIVVDEDNRIWVQVATESTRHPPEKPGEAATYTSPTAYDVYDQRLRFLGNVKFSETFRVRSAKGDLIWGTEDGDDGAPRVVRYRRSSRG